MKHSPRFLALVDEVRLRNREVTVAEVRTWVNERRPFRLIDVREDREWAAGHAAGAEHMARGVLERDVEKAIPDPSTEIVLYCGGGYRSLLSADSLRKMGYTRVLSLEGGWSAWTAAGAPTEGLP